MLRPNTQQEARKSSFWLTVQGIQSIMVRKAWWWDPLLFVVGGGSCVGQSGGEEWAKLVLSCLPPFPFLFHQRHQLVGSSADIWGVSFFLWKHPTRYTQKCSALIPSMSLPHAFLLSLHPSLLPTILLFPSLFPSIPLSLSFPSSISFPIHLPPLCPPHMCTPAYACSHMYIHSTPHTHTRTHLKNVSYFRFAISHRLAIG